MISQIAIRNFQSLKKIDLELGALTVIVGDSASGKSAFIRAIKAVSSNVRGSSFITSGATASSVSVQSQEWKITLEKSATSSSYKICDLLSGVEKEYTKLAGEVPVEITQLLGIEPFTEGRSVNFAGERDQPYLLDDSGQQVAKVLGDLTHVSTILEAVREANRRRTGSNASLKVRNADLDRLKAKLPKFQKLSAELQTMKQIETQFQQLEQLAFNQEKLSALIQAIENLDSVCEVRLPRLPDISTAELLFSRMKLMAQIARAIQEAISNASVDSEISALNTEILNLEKQYTETLIELGECPTCRQPITQM